MVRNFPPLPWSCSLIKTELEGQEDVDLQTLAHKEYLNYFLADKIGITSDTISTYNLQCYCNEIRHDYGYFGALRHKEEVKIPGNWRPLNSKVCSSYVFAKSVKKMISFFSPFIVLIINYFLKKNAIWAV